MPSYGQRDGSALSLEAIVDTAIELLERDGVAAVTMRKVASQCGASPMALYRHVDTKQALLRAVVDRHLADVELPNTEDLSWREAVIQTIVAAHRAFLAHPHLPEVLAVQHVDAITIFQATETVLRALRSAGLSDRDAIRMLDVLTACATGFTQRKAELRRRGTALDERLRRIRELPPEEFGTVRELAGMIVTADLDNELEEALAVVLDGVEQRTGISAQREGSEP